MDILIFDDSKIGPRVSDDVAYISKAELVGTIDGTESYDDQDGPGYDSKADNKIVRTFDSVISTLRIYNTVYGYSDYAKYEDGWVGYEFVLEGDHEKVEFDETNMPWLTTKPGQHKTFEVEVDGKKYQVMRGKFLWASDEPNHPAIGAANLDLYVAYSVLGMKNGDEIQPDFTFWMEYNDVPDKDKPIDEFTGENYTFVKDNMYACEVHDRVEPYHFQGEKIQVSAAPWYNAVLVEGGNGTNVVEHWDLASGQASLSNETETSIYGRSFAVGLGIQIRRPDGKGIRGCELPDGNDMAVSLYFDNHRFVGQDTGTNQVDSKCLPILWSYEGNSKSDTQSDGPRLTFVVPIAKAKHDKREPTKKEQAIKQRAACKTTCDT